MLGRSNAEPVDLTGSRTRILPGGFLRIDYAIGDDREVGPVSLDVD
ncbi:hypothetical protein IB267_32925 [Ensifer sp. ENS09]|nr:hypothetical protein [Ensifer sp. ENS09]MBD9653168.1 hypothetical protein [Ensifer sp. ENS09]